MPAVMNSMSQPSISSMMRSRSSIAACLPTSGSAPAPSPLVILQPICRAVRTFECFSACASVLMQMKSTPSRPACTMCETALPPPPPTPSTLMTAFWLYVSISSNIPSLLTSPVILKITLKPGLHAIKNIAHATRQQRRHALPFGLILRVKQQSDAGRVNRIADDVGQAGDVLRHAKTHRHVKYFFSEFDCPFHLCRSAGEDDSRRHRLLES